MKLSDLKTNVYLKLSIIFLLTVLLLIPSKMIQDLIHERQSKHNEAVYDVSSKWGNAQIIAGPVLSIPYDELTLKKTHERDEIITKTKWIHLLPDDLQVNSNLKADTRHRGIYDVVVYGSQTTVEGSFTDLDLEDLGIDADLIHMDQASLNMGISDLKGIQKQVGLKWNDSATTFNPGTEVSDVFRSGIHSRINLTDSAEQYRFKIELDLNGTENLHIVPIGKTTDVSMASNWANPSFGGNFLPDDREITQDGFKANWKVLNLNRNYPQKWTGKKYDVYGSTFGVDLIQTADNYQKNYRVAKYAILFLGFTFLAFFFVEVFQKVFIHPMQYLLVGLAIVLFYTLLLSISEHLSFNMAYLTAAGMTLLLITFYVIAILRSKAIGGMIASILTALYLFNFITIQQVDYALLIGSLGVFTILAIVMFFSRKIDWYSIRLGKDTSE